MKISALPQRSLFCAVLACASFHAAAQSGSSVQVYGLLDVGIDRISNVGGQSSTVQTAGMLAPNILGFRGSEDLGSGLKAVFKLENQFSMDTGASVTGDALFNRGAFVGLEGNFGAVKVGVLDDFMFTNLGLMRYGPTRMLPFVSLNFLRQGPFSTLTPTGSFDFDRVANARRVSNAVRYDSPNFGGWTFGALQQTKEKNDITGATDTTSLGALYMDGPWTFSLATTRARYQDINKGADGLTNWGVGGRRDFGDDSSISVLYTNTKNTLTNAKIDVYELAYMRPTSVNTRAIVQYTYMKGNAVLSDVSANQLNFSLHYLFSRRTNIYTSLAVQKVHGGGTAQIPLAGPSSSADQNVFRVGLFHAF